MPAKQLATAVVIASAGRPNLVAMVARDIDAMTVHVTDKVISVPDRSSLPADGELSVGWRTLVGTRGASAQRNIALDSLKGEPIVFFFDDDSVVRADYIANALEFFEKHSHVIGLTGRVLLDGAASGEVPLAEARSVLRDSLTRPSLGTWVHTRELYGCNFAVRFSSAPGIRFDDRLPLYSWLEDHDLARRLLPSGSLVKVDDCVIVHRAAASGGRQSHERLGYSQVMNPFYLWRKGSFPLWLMVSEMSKRVAKNLAWSFGSAESAWRRRRVWGNVLAAADLVRGRVTPERILEL